MKKPLKKVKRVFIDDQDLQIRLDELIEQEPFHKQEKRFNQEVERFLYPTVKTHQKSALDF